ncbi:DUF6531 domain-containing protein [Pseudomonas sp. LRF_L74]|uniref:DUF6531 domain-containing protein n=1 Tax=Pseudomonas sp. LRF_L74 TaxID=3369422 RepID=UPI003F641389
MSRICTYLSQKGSPGKNISCDIPSTKAGNPINIATANKYQREIDWSSGGIDFYRSYNSIDGLWRHSFSDHLVLNGNDITLILNDGREIKFKRSDSNDKVYRSISEIGTIENHLDGWTYRKDHGETLTFTQDGLLSAISKNYITHQINRENSENIISSDIYPDAYFTEDYFGQPKSFRFEGNQVYYSYSANKLVGVTITQDGESKSKIYHYENSKNPKILTGITDERGVRYATWSYDSQDRAISSEHAGGADKVTLVYNADGSTTVTNELGKKATYHFQVIQGVKRIVAIEGEPSPNCPSNNSTFTYDDRGLLKTKTDNKGYVTTYSYNDRGLEISRTEASGTAQARTTTTDWHPTLFLPETVTEPGRITHYQYDDQGRQLSQTIESL